MFKKLLASIGIGGARVDTLVEADTLYPGSQVPLRVVIEGGDSPQTISGLTIALMTRIKVNRDDSEFEQNHELCRWSLNETFELQPNEQKVYPFTITLPLETPITQVRTAHQRSHVWLATGLDIDMALDASDKDDLPIQPTPVVARALAFMERAGYVMTKADVEEGTLSGPGFRSTLGCYQELEYRPSSSSWFGTQEVELSFVPSEQQTYVLIELDRRFGGDSYRSLALHNHATDAEVEAALGSILG
jgi:sporulation-control protein